MRCLLWAEGVNLVDDAHFIVRHEEAGGMEQVVRLRFDFLAPILEDFGFAQAARDAVGINDNGVIITDAQPGAVRNVGKPGASLRRGGLRCRAGPPK